MLSPPHRITSLQTQESVTNPFSIERGSNNQYASSTFSINSSIVEGKCFFEFALSNAAKNDRSKWFKSGDRADHRLHWFQTGAYDGWLTC